MGLSPVDTFPIIYAYGGIETGTHWNPVMDTGSTRFICLGGADGQETWLYGVKDGKAYQPEVSGQHADFRKTEDGKYVAQPHEGGEGYYIIYYDFDPVTGEFVPIKAEGNTAKLESEGESTGHTHAYTGTITSEPDCGTGGIMTYMCGCGDSYTEAIEPTGEHDWERKEELVSYEDQGGMTKSTYKWTSKCRICGATRPY